MSTTSRAADHLAQSILMHHQGSYSPRETQVIAEVIDVHVSLLLEMLNQQTCSATDCGHADCEKIREALKPWKPENK